MGRCLGISSVFAKIAPHEAQEARHRAREVTGRRACLSYAGRPSRNERRAKALPVLFLRELAPPPCWTEVRE